MNLLLLRIGIQYLRRHKLQSLLLVVGVALGVAVVIAIDLANQSARRGFELSTQSIAGKATHQISAGPAGFSDSVYQRIRTELGLRASAPVVEGFVTVAELGDRPLRILGIDPFAEGPFRNYVRTGGSDGSSLDTLTPLLTEANTVLIGQDLAQQFQGHSLSATFGSTQTTLRIVGTITAGDRLSAEALKGMLITDISTAQQLLQRPGQLSHIDLILPQDTTGPQQAQRIQELLPPQAQLERPAQRSETLNQMTAAFSLNLTALSLLALLVGMFLIYNTITFSVVQRRPLFGTLRSLGVTRGAIAAMIFTETLLLALVGIAGGIGLGIVLGQGALQLVTRTINDLYFNLQVSELSLSPISLIKGGASGLIAALVAAIIPAWEATRTPPAGVMKRSQLEDHIRRLVPRLTLAGIALAFCGAALLALPTQSLGVSFASFFLVVIGAALSVPQITQFSLKYIPGQSLIMRMAPRSVSRALSRTAVAIAALMVAISVVVSVSIMIGSFRQTVLDWLDRTLSADIFITLPVQSQDPRLGLNPDILKEIQQLPGMRQAATARNVSITTQAYGPVNLLVLSRDIARQRRFTWLGVQRDQIWQHLEQGGVLVSQPFAYRHKIAERLGQSLTLSTEQGPRNYPIVGIYYDYASERGTVLMADPIYRQGWRDTLISSVALNLAPDQAVEKTVENLQNTLAGRWKVVVQSNQSLRQGAIEIFDRTFAITAALRLLAIVVAFMGIFSTLLALQLERTREFGMLRALGLTQGQLGQLILLESGLMGLTAGLLALPVGAVLSLFLIYVINVRSFGWTMDFLARPEYFLQALAISLIAALLAGLYPAWKIARLQPARALRSSD